MMVTFADGNKPPVVAALKEAQILFVITLIQNDMQHGYWQIIVRIVTIRTV